MGFWLARPRLLAALVRTLRQPFVGSQTSQDSPQSRPLRADVHRALVRKMNAFGARILFGGLGCPNQER
jgi:N-acetylglucosaminyldiphosphoundecaprenol N-acetyl-beta-D-mannosaminyltransferase